MQKNTITNTLIFVAIIALVLFGFTYLNNDEATEATNGDVANEETMSQDFPEINSSNPVVTLRTNMGDITLELYMDRTPITAGNFLKLSKEGFYNQVKFHRVISNFMIQGGDPNTKSDDVNSYGRGGPDYTIEDEFDGELSNLRGTISMANIGQPNSGGSQFFINLVPNVMLDFDKQPLTSKHPVFGHVLSGMDVVDAIAAVPTEGQDRPINPVLIQEVLVVREVGEAEEDTLEAPEEEAVEEATEEEI